MQPEAPSDHTLRRGERPHKTDQTGDKPDAKSQPLVEPPPAQGAKKLIRFGLVLIGCSGLLGCPETASEAKKGDEKADKEAESTGTKAGTKADKKAEPKADTKAEDAKGADTKAVAK